MSELQAKTAMVTGGAMGIGAACARAIVKAGGNVVIGDIADEQGAALAAELGDAAEFVHLDVSVSSDWRAAVAFAVDRFGALNVLVNNAGIITGGPLGSYSLEDWQRVIDVNLTGVFLGISACAEALTKHAPSSIVNMSSVAGLQGAPGYHAYCASKWAIRGLTKSAALELAPFDVRVNSVHPGTIRTPMTSEVPAEMARNAALNRFGEAEEVAELVVFLASDRSAYCTAAEFKVDGGESAGVGSVVPPGAE